MVKRPTLLKLHDIKEAVAGISETLDGVDYDKYKGDWEKRRATERGIEIVSEASRHVPQSLKDKHSDIPWQAIAAMGNRLRHEYQKIDDKVVWDTAKKHLPKLSRAIDAMIKETEREHEKKRSRGRDR